MLRTEPVADPDGLYQLLVEAHRDLSAEQSQLLNSKLVLVLANHIGDPEVVAAALAAARGRPRLFRAGTAGAPEHAADGSLPRGRGLAMLATWLLPARSPAA